MGTVEEQNKEFIRHMFELCDKEKSLDSFFNICDSNYVEHWTDHDESLEEAKQGIRDSLPVSELPHYNLIVDHLLADGDKVAYRVTHRWTDKATGKNIQMTNTCIVRMENGKVMENWVSVDILHVMQQFGVLPSTEDIMKNATTNTN